MKASTTSTTFVAEFDNEWLSGVFKPVFDDLTLLASCIAGIATYLHPNLGAALDALFIMLVDLVQASITFFVYVGQAGGTPSGVIASVYSNMDTTPAAFMDPVFVQAELFAQAFGGFFSIIDTNFGHLVSNTLSMAVEFFRGIYRFSVIMMYGLAHDGGASAALSDFKTAWRSGSNGGKFSALFAYWNSAATNAGTITGYIHSSLGCITTALLYYPAHLLLFSVGLFLCFTDSDVLSSLQSNWSAIFVTHLFSPLTGLVTCLSSIISSIDTQLGCLVGAVLTIAIDWSEFVLSIFVYFNIIFLDGNGMENTIDTNTPFNDITALGACIQSFMYSLTSSCSTLNFFCKAGDTIYDVFSFASAVLKKLIIDIPDSITTNSGISSAVNIQDIITSAETFLSDASLMIASLVPFPNTGYCTQSQWQTNIGNMIYHALDVVLIPAKIMNLFLTSVFGSSTDVGTFLSSLLTVLFNVIINLLNDLGSIVSCLTGSGSFFTTLATIVGGLLTVFSDTVLNIITDILRLAVDIFTGNFSDFGAALGQLLTDFGNFFASIALQILNAIIPGGADALNSVLNFFTGTACTATETAINAMVDAINAMVVVVRCIGCPHVTCNTQCTSCGSCTSLNCAAGLCSDWVAGCSAGLCGSGTCGHDTTVCSSSCGDCGISSVGYVSMCNNKRSNGEPDWSGMFKGGKRAADTRTPTSSQSRRSTYQNDTGDTTAFQSSSFYNSEIIYDYMIYKGEFGSNLNTTDTMSVIQSILNWDGETMCDVVINGFKGQRWTDIGLSDRAFMAECVQKRFTAIKLGLAIGWIGIPQDMFYNWMRPFGMVKDAIVGSVMYATCYMGNETCAYDTQDLATKLEAAGVDYSLVLYILGMGEITLENVLGYSQVEALVQKLGAQSSISALISDVNRLFVGASTVIINATVSHGNLIGAMYDDIGALGVIYNNTVANITDPGQVMRHVVNNGTEGYSRRNMNPEYGIGARAYASEVIGGLYSAIDTIMDPNGGHIRTLVDSIFIGGRDSCDAPWSNTTQCAAAEPRVDIEGTLLKMNREIDGAKKHVEALAADSRESIANTLLSTSHKLSDAVGYISSLPDTVERMKDDIIRSVADLSRSVNETVGSGIDSVLLYNATSAVELRQRVEDVRANIMRNITDSVSMMSSKIELSISSVADKMTFVIDAIKRYTNTTHKTHPPHTPIHTYAPPPTRITHPPHTPSFSLHAHAHKTSR